MKKKLFLGLLAAAAVSFTACQKDEVLSEVPQDNAIGFSTYVGRDAQTKADVATVESLKSGFGVFAYHTGIGESNKYNEITPSHTPNFMYNQEVYYDAKWTYSPTKYWPSSQDQISFIAYAPYDCGALSLNNYSGDPTLTYTVAEEVEDQKDVLYAAQLNKKQSDGEIKFEFNHALSKIGFKAKTSNSILKVTVKSISLTGDFYTTAPMNIRTGNFDLTGKTPVSTPYELTFTSNNTAEGTTPSVISADEGFIMIIPQDFTSKSITVTASYDIQEKDPSTSTYGAPTTYTATGSISGIEFIKNYGYTFVLILDPKNEITFGAPTIVPWDEQADSNVDCN